MIKITLELREKGKMDMNQQCRKAALPQTKGWLLSNYSLRAINGMTLQQTSRSRLPSLMFSF